jgi:hypothetical protein
LNNFTATLGEWQNQTSKWHSVCGDFDPHVPSNPRSRGALSWSSGTKGLAMVNPTTRRPERGDEENTSFGLPVRALERKAGASPAPADQQDDSGNHRRRPSDTSAIRQETLAERIARELQEGGNS